MGVPGWGKRAVRVFGVFLYMWVANVSERVFRVKALGSVAC